MLNQNVDTFSLSNFEGPLDFLLNLIQREEIDIYEISIQELTQQFLTRLREWHEQRIEKGAEFIGSAAYLVWLKSKMLLPKHEELPFLPEEEEDPHFEIIHHLLDYCRFKQAAKNLSLRQEQQSACFFRGSPSGLIEKKPLGIHHLSLDELAQLFQGIISRAPIPKGQIYEENWKVSDKIHLLRQLAQANSPFPLEELFQDKPRVECIVIFLALLELIKSGEIKVGKSCEQKILVLCLENEVKG